MVCASGEITERMQMKHKCTACGHEDEINPGKLLGGIRTPKREAAWKKHGERLKTMFANARKVGAGEPSLEHPKPKVVGGVVQPLVGPVPLNSAGFIAPKGSFTKEDLKAIIAGGAPRAEKDLHETPHAPFDFNEPESGEPHRVTQMGKKLGLFYLGGGEPSFSRYLAPGELEKFWERRII